MSLLPAWLTTDAWLAPQFDYNGDYDTERVLITKGSATLTPDDGSDVVKIGAGDSVYTSTRASPACGMSPSPWQSIMPTCAAAHVRQPSCTTR